MVVETLSLTQCFICPLALAGDTPAPRPFLDSNSHTSKLSRPGSCCSDVDPPVVAITWQHVPAPELFSCKTLEFDHNHPNPRFVRPKPLFMSSNHRSSASYAYYSFPPTPNRSSPPGSIEDNSRTPSPQTARTSKSMAPSPAAGKAPNTPKTPTKVGRNPSSSASSKLGQSQSAADSPKNTAKSATSTPQGAAKGATDKAKSAASSKPSGSPKLPPRPQGAGKAGQTAKDAAPQAVEKAEDAKGPAEDTADDAKDTAEDTKEDAGDKIGMKDNDPSDDTEDTETPTGKVSQPGNETGAEDSSAVSTQDQDEGGDATGGARDPAPGATDLSGAADQAKGTAGKGTEEAKDTSEEGTQKARDTGEEGTQKAQAMVEEGAEKSQDTADDAQDTADEGAEQAPDTAENGVEGAEEGAEGVEDTAEDAAEGATDEVDGVTDEADGIADEADEAGETVDGVEDEAGDAVDGVEDDVDEAGEDVADQVPVDLSVLKGLEVGEGGEILGADGEPLGQLEEGDPEDLIGKTIGDNGEILDEDGDVIGRASVLPEKAEELAQKARDALPDIGVLEGLEVGDDGQIMGEDGTPLGKVVEGEAEDLVGQKVNDKGEILDEEGDVIGRVEVVPGEAADKINETKEAAEAGGLKPDLSILAGKKINKKGKILDEEGEPIGQVTEDSDVSQCAGKTPNENGEVVNSKGDVVGHVEVVPGEAADAAMRELHPDLAEAADKAEAEAAQVEEEAQAPALPGLDILEGLKVNKKGEVLNEDGEPIARLSEGELADCAGKKLNANGEVLDKDGNVIGKVELIPEAFPAAAEGEEAVGEAGEEGAADEEAAAGEDLSVLHGLKVNKKGVVFNEDGDPIARLAEGELEACAGKTLNEKGEVLDAEGNVIGRVELIPTEPEAAEEAAAGEDLSMLDGLKVNKKGEVVNEDGDAIARLAEGEIEACAGKKLNEKGEVLDAEGNVIGRVELIPTEPEAAEEPEGEAGPDFSMLDGLKVNKKGEVINEDGDLLARLIDGELEACAGKKLNEKGEVLDAEGNVIGKVELVSNEPEEETGPELPPLSILEGCKCNKQGKVVNEDGKPLGELVEGDAKRLSKLGAECDAEGQFWDGKGKVIGRAQTLPQDDDEEEAPFAGLYGLIVVKDGFVEDENENKVGVLVEGDAAKLVGRAVDEDGDVLDKRGNVVGHAERYEEPEEVEEEKPDLSILNGLVLNKQGNVIGPEGVPIARLVEGNAKELAGRKCDGEGQIWNDAGKVVGRCELIPENEREAKPEGPFAGLEGLVVVKGGMVEDEDGNTVGQVVEGDPKRLVGRAVDEDGDIVDKYGNVKGHAEPYEEDEEPEVDLSILNGKVVNKAGNVVDEHGTIFGRIVEGDPIAMAGRKCDGEGKIWGDTGNVIGQAELIPGGEQLKPEGPFSGFENLVVAKDGFVVDQNEQKVGRVIEGDPEALLGRKVDDDGDILDKAGNSIGKAERYHEEEKEREINPMAGHRVNNEGEVRDDSGNLIGRLTEGNLGTCIGKEIDDNGYVVDNDGNRVGECTLIQNIQEEEEEEEEPELTEEELAALRKKEEDAEIAKKMTYILKETLDKMQPICNNITEVSSLKLPDFTLHHLLMTL